MTLIPQYTSPLEDVWVALDLETTGLSAEKDEIIEIGAVKFQGDKVLDTFQTFVNPHKRLSNFIKRFTGIQQHQVDEAPPFAAIAGKFGTFLGSAPIIGHNIAFDVGFLEKSGLRIANPKCDTWDMVYVLHPSLPEYSLSKLSSRNGLTHDRPHRALDDAMATKELFLMLAEEASKLDVYTLAEMQRLASRSSWVLDYLLRGLEAQKSFSNTTPGLISSDNGTSVIPQAEPGTLISPTGLDNKELSNRLQQDRALRPNMQATELDVDFVASLLDEGSPLAEALPGFEERTEQVQMARAVAEAINQGSRLIVEAGTGVGKSLAYLLPAALYALKNNKRVVVSTNTINLQEQLVSKDIPVLVEALSQLDDTSAEDLKFTLLKGRANYLCLRRWNSLRTSENITDDEARLLSKILVWLQTTTTGDRSELTLGNRNTSAPWERLSAQGATECLSLGGPCFLRASRERAAASHLVIVNHALLLSDVTAESKIIPEYDILIVDEAHHLEDEATRHLGFELSQSRFDDHFQSLGGERGLLNESITAFRTSSAAFSRRETVEQVAAEITALLPRVRENVTRMFASLTALVGGSDNQNLEFRITQGTRVQPGWSDLEMEWENADLVLAELGGRIRNLNTALEGLEESNLLNYEGLIIDIINASQANTELRERLKEFIPNPKDDGIYWVTNSARRSDITLHGAPLHVGETLDELLFRSKESVVLTSATLSTNGTFNHISERTGFINAEKLLLGSPFDYPNAALLCVPNDMPEPNSWAYQEAIEEAIKDAALAVDGRTMTLFTSHAALQSAASSIREDLQSRGIRVLAQGVDGSPQQLVRRFVEDPKAVLLGTASFWEGVDLAGDVLKVLLVTRLPFSVPSDPVFEARSELYDNAFMEYAVPQAILRLRQGFGRLIRTKTDKGVAIILDKRTVSRRYGKAFLQSLPPGTFKSGSLFQLSDDIKHWMDSS